MQNHPAKGPAEGTTPPEFPANLSEPKPLRVLFLDIDGVLNSHRSCLALGGISHDASPDGLTQFDPLALAMVRGLCRGAGLSVVLSSSWRILNDWRELGPQLGLPMIGATPRLAGARGNEIAAWLLDHPEPVEAYAIVDDDGDMLPDQLPRFVQTRHTEGLLFGDVEKLAALFGVNVWDCAAPRRYAGRRNA